MPLRVRCPTGHKLIVPDDRAGRSLRCPRCGQVTVVPGERRERTQESGARSQEPGASADVTRRRDSSSVIDWPNSIAPPTAVALDPSAVDQVISGEVIPPPPPAIEPPPAPIIKPKSRALPPRTPEPRSKLPPDNAPSPPPPPMPPQAPVAPVEAVPAALPEVVFVAESPPLPPPPPQVGEPPPATEPEPVAAPPVMEASAPQPVTLSAPAQQTQPSAAEPAPPSPEVVQRPVHPLLPDHNHQLAIYQLAAALVAAALFSIAPAVWDIVEYVQIPESQFVARWALVLLLLGAVQIAYTIYLVQLPDWTSVWVITIFLLFLAAIYAAVLGLVLISSESGLVVGALQLADKLAGGKAVLWCLCMVGVSTILAFFAGRLSARWHKTEMFLRQTGLNRGAI